MLDTANAFGRAVVPISLPNFEYALQSTKMRHHRGRLGVVNAFVAGLFVSAGATLEEVAQRRQDREGRGLEPLSLETRLVVYCGAICTVIGGILAVATDAMLPQSTQAPLMAWTVAMTAAMRFGRSRKDVEQGLLDDEVYGSTERSQQPRGLICAFLGPVIALTGARYDDLGGLAPKRLLSIFQQPSAIAIFFVTLAALGLAVTRKNLDHRLKSALLCAFTDAWTHVAVKATVEEALFILTAGPVALFGFFATFVVAIIALASKLLCVSRALPHGILPLSHAVSIPLNALCGIFFWNDFHFFHQESSTSADVVAFLVGLAVAVVGVLLISITTLDDDDLHDGLLSGLVFFSSSGDDDDVRKPDTSVLLKPARSLLRGEPSQQQATDDSSSTTKGPGLLDWEKAAEAASIQKTPLRGGLDITI